MSTASPFIPVARHVGIDEVPWVPNPAVPGASMRLLQADTERGLYVTAGRLDAGIEVGIHRHTGAVHMFTLSGAWRYLEHEYVNRAGSYLYEPEGSVHTFSVLPDQGITETLTVIYGETQYLDPAGEVIATTNAATNLRAYYEACEAAGVPRPNGILR
jgi:hypothetical protein